MHNLAHKPLRIAMIGNHWSAQSGGMERYFFGLTRQLASAGDSVDFFTLNNPPADYHGARGWSMAPQSASTLRRFQQSYATFNKAFRAPFDVVNTHFALTSIPALPSLPKHARVVATFHGPWALEGNAEGQGGLATRVKMLAERFTLKRASRYITVSRAFGDLLSELHNIDRKKIHTVPLGIDTDFFRPVDRRHAREQLGWPQDRRIIFTARRLIARVGVNELIGAFSKIKDLADIWCAIAGRGPLETQIQERIDAHNVQQHVKLVGFLSDEELALAYAAANLVILPSQNLEGFGSVIAESLAAGTPVMVTPVGGMPEFIRPLGEHLVMSGKTPDAMADSLRTFTANSLLLPDRESCRAYACDNFSWPRVAQKVRDIFAAQE